MKILRLDGDRCRILFEYPPDVDLREMDRDHDAMIRSLAGRVEVIGPREVLRGDAGVAMEFPGRVLPGAGSQSDVEAAIERLDAEMSAKPRRDAVYTGAPQIITEKKAPAAIGGTAGVDLAAVQEAASAAKGQGE